MRGERLELLVDKANDLQAGVSYQGYLLYIIYYFCFSSVYIV